MTSSKNSQGDSTKQNPTTKKASPRGPVPSLIGGSNGKPERATAKRKSVCKRCGKEISNGQECIEIPDLNNVFSNRKRFCNDCFKKILEKTQKDLDKLLTI